jgi:hypothetical protein
VKVNLEPWRLILAQLAANGFGSPEILSAERADLIIDAWDYLNFRNKYEQQSWLISREKT